MIGSTFSHCAISAKLGQGGMGEVYRASDTKLNRNVAIKVLPEAFVANAQRLARFKREAQLLAAFNHTNDDASERFMDRVREGIRSAGSSSGRSV